MKGHTKTLLLLFSKQTARIISWNNLKLVTFCLQFIICTSISLSYADFTVKEYPVPSGSRPHDVAPAVDGGIWYTAQRKGALGYLNPNTGQTVHIPLGKGSAPHGVIVGPDGAPWVTDGGLNAIIRVDPKTKTIKHFPLAKNTGYTNLNTATFDNEGILWFTGQSGVYGNVNPTTKAVNVFPAPRGSGPYGIHTTPSGEVYYASLAGNHIAHINIESGTAKPIDPPTPKQGARRVWSDSKNRIWVSEWIAGKVGVYDTTTKQWREWTLPGNNPKAYAVYVDDQDIVWLSDFAANAIVRFDPNTETFARITIPSPNGQVRQILGRPGEVWAPQSAQDKLMVIYTK
ncbi:Vgb family protein [Zooshikella sp. RANM57]|uniref:Vgb family protein n=1 Tax=Zooshikella sp. RANM57 TaxID=3425863 RepID=UPI003D6DE64A